MPPRHKKKRKNQAAAAAAAAAKRRDWLVGDLVVAKLRGHRPWPAQIQKPEDYGYEARPHRIFVTFFGTEETCFCTHNKITPFTSAMRKSMAEQLQKINTNPELERAIKEIFAADDELKVSMKSQNKSDDEKSDEEDEQPAEASTKPLRKKAKIAPQEDAVGQEPVVRSAGKESTRPTRAAAAAAAAAQSSKQEKATDGGSSVKNMAAHQVQKLPRKVRIKVSSQSSDSANHQSVGEVTVAVTDKASVSSQSQKSEVESPSRSEIDAEKKADATSSPPSPKSAAAEAESSKNGDVEMEEATRDASTSDAEVAKKSGEHSSADGAEDEDLSKVDEGDSAKIEVSGDEETMGDRFDVAKESSAEDSEKDCESTAVKMEIDAQSNPETEAAVVKEGDDMGRVKITAFSVDEDHINKQSSRIVVEDGKLAATVTPLQENCEPTIVAKVEDEVFDSTAESQEKSKLGDRTPTGLEESKSSNRATEVDVSASTVQGTAESKGCESPIIATKVDKVSDSSVEVGKAGRVCNSTAEPMQVETTCSSPIEERQEDPAGESKAKAEGAEQSCEETGSSQKIYIPSETPASAEEGLIVTTENSKVESRDFEAPTVAKEEVKDSYPPPIVANEVNNCNSIANIEEVKDCKFPAIAKDELEDSSADTKQEEKVLENAACVEDSLQENARNSERAVMASKEKDFRSATTVDPLEKDGGGESTPQVKEDLESTPAEKAVEKESEITPMETATTEAVEKDQEHEGEQDVGKVDMDDSCDVVPAEKEENLPDSILEDCVKTKVAAGATENEEIRKDETASAAPAAD